MLRFILFYFLLIYSIVPVLTFTCVFTREILFISHNQNEHYAICISSKSKIGHYYEYDEFCSKEAMKLNKMPFLLE